MTTKLISSLNCRATRISARTTTSLVAALLLSTSVFGSHDAECQPITPITMGASPELGPYVPPPLNNSSVDGIPTDTTLQGDLQLGRGAHGATIKSNKEKEEDKNAGDPLSETEGWKASGEGNTDKFYGQNGDYLTHTVEGQEMLFHSNDGGKTYYPVKNGSYQIADGKVSLQQGFNPSAPGAVEGRVTGGGSEIANTVPQAYDPFMDSDLSKSSAPKKSPVRPSCPNGRCPLSIPPPLFKQFLLNQQ